MKKKIVYIDMDGVVADFDKNVHLLGERDPERKESVTPPNYFFDLDLIEGASEALNELSKYYDLYFLSTPQWVNTLSWTEKANWVKKHFGELMFKKLILSHNKGLLKGDYLIDDNVHSGFEGEHIHFGTAKFPDWKKVTRYLTNKFVEDRFNDIRRDFVKSLGIILNGDYTYEEYKGYTD